MLALPPGRPTEILGDNSLSDTPSAPGEIVPTHSSPPPITIVQPSIPDAEAFLRFKRIPLSPNGGPRKEWILGRDEPLATMGTPVNNISFAFADPGLKPRHARILATAATIDEAPLEGDAAPKTKIVGREYSIEALDGAVFLNELGIEPGAPIPLKDQDVLHLGEGGKKLTFKIEGNIGFLQEAPIPLDPTKSEWTIGRLASKGPAADVTVPSSERQVSRLHARILRNAKGQYFLENISSEGTFLGGDRIYGVKPLLHQDKVQIGGLHEKGDTPIFWFETPRVTRGKPPKDLPHFPKLVPPPRQAEVHPEYRGLGWREVLAHVQGIRQQLEQGQSLEKALTDMGLSDQQLADAGLASSRPMPPSIQLARLAFSNKLTLELESDMTGFIIGSRPSHPDDPPYTAPLEIQGALEARHARLFIDVQGRFILEDLNSAKGVFVHPRTYRDVEKIIENPRTNEVKTENERKWHEIPDKLPHLARVSGWTFLYGGERVYLGKKLYFDFWPGTVYEAHRGGTSRVGEVPVPETNQDPEAK